MSDTPKDPGAGSGETPEYSDPTSPTWDEGERSDQTEALQPPSATQPLEPEPGPGPGPDQGTAPEPQSPYGQPGPYGQPPAPNPYGQAQNPYAAGAPGGYPTSRPGPPPVPGAPGTAGAGFPPGPPAQYGQPGYGQPGYGPPAPGQPGQGYAPSPYGRPQQGATNTSAIVLLVVSGLSTLVGCFFAIPALILGIMAVVKQGESPADSAKFTRWGWIAYGVAVAFVVIGGIIAAAILFGTSSTSTGY